MAPFLLVGHWAVQTLREKNLAGAGSTLRIFAARDHRPTVVGSGVTQTTCTSLVAGTRENQIPALEAAALDVKTF